LYGYRQRDWLSGKKNSDRRKSILKKEGKRMNELRFTPYAWAKLNFMRDISGNEVGGYGISSIDDLLLISDFILVKQKVSPATFAFEDKGLADYAENMLDVGLQPVEYSRILIHTHPGNSASPSSVDEENFQTKFSECNWAVMFILAKGGATSACIRFNNPQVRAELKTVVDYSCPFPASEIEAWKEEYNTNVSTVKVKRHSFSSKDKYRTPPGYITRETCRLPLYSFEKELEDSYLEEEFGEGFYALGYDYPFMSDEVESDPTFLSDKPSAKEKPKKKLNPNWRSKNGK
jgi:hypothetical protein